MQFCEILEVEFGEHFEVLSLELAGFKGFQICMQQGVEGRDALKSGVETRKEAGQV